MSVLLRAGDQETIDLIEALAISTRKLSQSDPDVCYRWHYGGYGFMEFDFAQFRKALGDGLLKQQFQRYGRLVESASLRSRDAATTDDDANALARAMFAMTQRVGNGNIDLILGERPPIPDSKDTQVACEARLVLYRSLLAEPDAAGAIRKAFMPNNQ